MLSLRQVPGELLPKSESCLLFTTRKMSILFSQSEKIDCSQGFDSKSVVHLTACRGVQEVSLLFQQPSQWRTNACSSR